MSNGDMALAIAALGLLAIGLAATFSRTLEAWYDRFRAWRELRRAQPTVRRFAHASPVVMSRPTPEQPPRRPVAPPVAQAVQLAGQPIATTGNAINSELHRSTELPEDARDIIRFQAKVESLASLYKSGQVSNLAKAIEATFECSRTSKEESTYQRAKRAIEPLIAKPVAATPIAGRETSAVFAADDG